MSNKIKLMAFEGKVQVKIGDAAFVEMTPVQAFDLASDLMTKAKEAKSHITPKIEYVEKPQK
jgi:hypothetical protein